MKNVFFQFLSYLISNIFIFIAWIVNSAAWPKSIYDWCPTLPYARKLEEVPKVLGVDRQIGTAELHK